LLVEIIEFVFTVIIRSFLVNNSKFLT